MNDRGAGPNGEPRQDLVEELLELLWTMGESGSARVSRRDPEAALADESRHGQEQEHLHGRMAEAISKAVALGWVESEGDDVRLTPGGEERARMLIRRHRLAGHLFRVRAGRSESMLPCRLAGAAGAGSASAHGVRPRSAGGVLRAWRNVFGRALRS